MAWKRFVGVYRKLDWAGRLGVWAAIASIASLALYFVTASPHKVPPPSINITVPVFNNVQNGSTSAAAPSQTSATAASADRQTAAARGSGQPSVRESTAASGSTAHPPFDHDIVQKLRDAHSYAVGGNTSGEAEALRLYRQALRELSGPATRQLDQRLMGEAEQEFAAGDIEDAVRTYRALFADVVAAAGRPR